MRVIGSEDLYIPSSKKELRLLKKKKHFKKLAVSYDREVLIDKLSSSTAVISRAIL